MRASGLWLLAGLLLTLPAAAEGDVAITAVQGEAFLVRDGAETPAAPQAFRPGDGFRTAPGATIDLALNAVAGVRVLGGSEGTVPSAAPEDMAVRLEKGEAIANLEKLKKGSSFRVETPTAVAAARGTQFYCKVDALVPGEPRSTFVVREGSIEVSTPLTAEPFLLTQGQALDVPKTFEAPPTVRPALGDEIVTMEQASTVKTCA